MNIHLGDLEEYVQEKLAAGGYASAAEVIREALRKMRSEEREDAIERRLQAYVRDGIDQGPPDGVPSDDWERRLAATRLRLRRFVEEGIESGERDGFVDGEEVERRIRERRRARSEKLG